jgi:hypothetical protein
VVAVGVGLIGYSRMSVDCGLGMSFVAAKPVVRAAAPGRLGRARRDRCTDHRAGAVPAAVGHQLVPRAQGLAPFDALRFRTRTLHANPGHGDVPNFETDDAVRLFARHLG